MENSIKNVEETIKGLSVVEGDTEEILKTLDEGKKKLLEAREQMEGITVKGRDPLDMLLGCILAIEMITGEDNNG